jgi:hypothetical protein
MINLKNKILYSYLPIFLATGLIVGFLWFFLKDKPVLDTEKDVIDLSQPVIKHQDQLGTVEVDSSGGKKELVQLKFSWEIQGIKYNDAINLTKAEYEKMTAEDLEQIKNERFYNWANSVNSQSKLESVEDLK